MESRVEHPSWWSVSIVELRRQVASGQRSALSLVQESLERIEATKSSHEVILELNTRVVQDAIELDEAVASYRRESFTSGQVCGPLAGIPVLVKANIAVQGMSVSAGNPVFNNLIATQDAPVVAALRAAGALVLGTVNTSEFAWHGTFTTSSLGGTTGNAFNPGLSASGSSGGSAVAVALGLAPLAVGTDTCGSVVGPATHAGLVGWRPSYDLLSTSGVVPLAPAQDTVGVIARSVADVQVAAQVLTSTVGEEHDNTFQLASEPLHLAYLEWPLSTAGSPQLTAGARESVRAEVAKLVRDKSSQLLQLPGIREVGCKFTATDAVTYLPGSGYREVALALTEFTRTALERKGIAQVRSDRMSKPEEQKVTELVAQALRAACIDTTTVENWLEVARTAPDTLAESLRRGANQRKWWSSYLQRQDIDALIYATSPETASADWAGTAAAALSSHGGSPSITVPIGNVGSLPVGLTVLTQPGQDALALHIAAQLEEITSYNR